MASKEASKVVNVSVQRDKENPEKGKVTVTSSDGKTGSRSFGPGIFSNSEREATAKASRDAGVR